MKVTHVCEAQHKESYLWVLTIKNSTAAFSYQEVSLHNK